MMSEKIAIIGGAFDPPTVAHLHLAKIVLSNTSINEVWLMPCHKSVAGKEISDSLHRLSMTKLAVNSLSKLLPESKKVKVCEYEVKHKLNLPTFDVLNLLSTTVDKKLIFCIGTDQANTIYSWHKWVSLTSKYEFIIFSGRDGKTLNNDPWRYITNHQVINIHESYTEISSTNVRKNIGSSKVKRYVTPEVLNYITKEGLYNGRYGKNLS